MLLAADASSAAGLLRLLRDHLGMPSTSVLHASPSAAVMAYPLVHLLAFSSNADLKGWAAYCMGRLQPVLHGGAAVVQGGAAKGVLGSSARRSDGKGQQEANLKRLHGWAGVVQQSHVLLQSLWLDSR